jgi:hypothetical protein
VRRILSATELHSSTKLHRRRTPLCGRINQPSGTDYKKPRFCGRVVFLRLFPGQGVFWSQMRNARAFMAWHGIAGLIVPLGIRGAYRRVQLSPGLREASTSLWIRVPSPPEIPGVRQGFVVAIQWLDRKPLRSGIFLRFFVGYLPDFRESLEREASLFKNEAASVTSRDRLNPEPKKSRPGRARTGVRILLL